MFTMSPLPCAFISGTTRFVMSTRPKTLVSNILLIASTSSAPISAAVRVAGVVDEDVDAAHALQARLDASWRCRPPRRHVGANAVRAGLLRDLLDALLVAAGEHDLVTGLARQFDDGRADPLAAAGDEKTSCQTSLMLSSWFRPSSEFGYIGI